MLIITPRHTETDLKLWKEYEEMDRITAIPKNRVNESIRIISEWIKVHPNGAAYTSWGKDSVVLLHLIYKTGLKIPVVYARFTDMYNPDCELVRDEFLKRYDIDYYEDSFDCPAVREAGAHWKSLQKKYGLYRLTGVRNDESGIRTMVYLMYRESSKFSCRPLSLWKNNQIFGYIEQNGLPLCPVYGYLGGGRWDRKHIRAHTLSGTAGDNFGRTEWEREYYPDILARIAKGVSRDRV
jgi:3'-phosphoadenosine 5'-phosphosulfate sulfotransferase (PAPS reductase)/FAD synthetase